jgi:3-oxoacyl-[acyl-carrier protein] reductase
MDLKLEEKVILVTGSSSGLGLACAKILVAEGAHVILNSRTEENLEQAADEIESELGIRPAYLVADVSDPVSIEDMKSIIKENIGRLDGMVLNAGGPPMGAALEFEDAEWYAAIETNLLSGIRLSRAFVPMMQEQKFGRIVAITSSGVKQALPNLVLSNTTRMGLTGFLKTLANEVARDNVLINTLLPGPTNTNRLKSNLKNAAKKQKLKLAEVIENRTRSIPAGRFGEPEEMATLLAYLISGANTHITGQSIAVDGGMVSSNL